MAAFDAAFDLTSRDAASLLIELFAAERAARACLIRGFDEDIASLYVPRGFESAERVAGHAALRTRACP